MSEARMDINWSPPGPVSEAFMHSTAKVQIINGPVGGGKTTTAFIKAVRLACAQRVSRGRTINIGDGERPATPTANSTRPRSPHGTNASPLLRESGRVPWMPPVDIASTSS